MKSKSRFEFIYQRILPFAVGFTVMTVLQILFPELIKRLSGFQLFVFMAFMLMPVMIILKLIEGIVFERKDTMAAKMMNCSLRKEYGLDYCVKCPDSYTCASGVESGR